MMDRAQTNLHPPDPPLPANPPPRPTGRRRRCDAPEAAGRSPNWRTSVL